MKQNILNFSHEPEFKNRLERIAEKIIYKASARGLPLKNIFCEPSSGQSSHNLKEILVSEICRFLLENQEMVENALSRTGNNMGVCLERLFFRNLLDCSRQLNTDSYRYLYKFVVDMMRKKPDRFFLNTEDKRGSSFSLNQNSRPAGPIAPEDLKDLAFPYDRSFPSDFDSIRKQKIMEPLAVYFWEKLCQKFNNTPIRVHVRDFVSWLALHIPVTQVFCSFSDSPKSSSTDVHEPQTTEDIFDLRLDFPISVVGNLEIERTQKYARLFANRLTGKEKAAMVLRFDQDMDLSSMAQKLGYKGPSGPANLMDSITAKLKNFLRDLPWLGPEDLDRGGQEIFNIFLEHLMVILKKSDLTPYEL